MHLIGRRVTQVVHLVLIGQRGVGANSFGSFPARLMQPSAAVPKRQHHPTSLNTAPASPINKGVSARIYRDIKECLVLAVAGHLH